MEQLLYWLEPEEKWQSRGYANHRWLKVNYDDKTYSLTTTYYYPKGSEWQIEVQRKGDLKRFAEHLKKNGFKED